MTRLANFKRFSPSVCCFSGKLFAKKSQKDTTEKDYIWFCAPSITFMAKCTLWWVLIDLWVSPRYFSLQDYNFEKSSADRTSSCFSKWSLCDWNTSQLKLKYPIIKPFLFIDSSLFQIKYAVYKIFSGSFDKRLSIKI